MSSCHCTVIIIHIYIIFIIGINVIVVIDIALIYHTIKTLLLFIFIYDCYETDMIIVIFIKLELAGIIIIF